MCLLVLRLVGELRAFPSRLSRGHVRPGDGEAPGQHEAPRGEAGQPGGRPGEPPETDPLGPQRVADIEGEGGAAEGGHAEVPRRGHAPHNAGQFHIRCPRDSQRHWSGQGQDHEHAATFGRTAGIRGRRRRPGPESQRVGGRPSLTLRGYAQAEGRLGDSPPDLLQRRLLEGGQNHG